MVSECDCGSPYKAEMGKSLVAQIGANDTGIIARTKVLKTKYRLLERSLYMPFMIFPVPYTSPAS